MTPRRSEAPLETVGRQLYALENLAHCDVCCHSAAQLFLCLYTACQVETRLGLAQQLLVLQHLVLGCSASTGLSPAALDSLQSTFLPRTTVMAHCYTVLLWLCTAPTSPPSNTAQVTTTLMCLVQEQCSLLVWL